MKETSMAEKVKQLGYNVEEFKKDLFALNDKLMNILMVWNVIWRGCKPTGGYEIVSEPWMSRDSTLVCFKCFF